MPSSISITPTLDDVARMNPNLYRGITLNNVLLTLKNASSQLGYISHTTGGINIIPFTTLPVNISGSLHISHRSEVPTGPTNGDIYYNSTTNLIMAYENGGWRNL